MTLSLSQKKWEIRPVDERLALTFSQRFGLSDGAARLLAGRGMTLETVEDFLTPSLKKQLPDPLILKDMDKAVERLARAIQGEEKIAIFGDYDVDGATSSALLKRFFRALGIEVAVHIPDRMTEGYGPSIQAFEMFIQGGIQVVITVDCGTTSFGPLAYAHEKGLDVIVLDHHGAEIKLPPCVALVNPNRLDEGEGALPLTHLAAVGMSFLFAVALNRRLREEGFYATRAEPDLMALLDLVALGTVCDVMPLKGLNRAFVKQGLKVMARRENMGLRTLADGAGIDQAPNAYHLGFLLGPRINAGGRVGQSSLGSRLLSTEDGPEAQEIAQSLHALNEERKEIEREVLESALNQAQSQATDAPVQVVASGGWHEGVIGIVAGRLKEQYNVPACVISVEGGMGKGSARSIPGVDLGALVRKATHLEILKAGGGHAMAAGFSLEEKNIEKFRGFLHEEVSALAAAIDLTPSIKVDGYLSLAGAHVGFVRELEALGPYGMGHSSPRFLLDDVIVDHARLVGQDHVACQLRHSISGKTARAIAFRQADTELGRALQDGNRYPLCLLVTLKYDLWNGQEQVQIIIEDGRYSLNKSGTYEKERVSRGK